ncbi:MULTISPECIES: beta strand repeat-containing protein [Halorussus]|uniref:beta strand repeat-containing protein n=1 Tax=Halorussus TaxID=1070314 RepID=UPI00209E704A|nr:FG-GAP-like repeat-containing protein [Halorussus vallis]USZ75328.1 integrin alpha [Halorussus vallis]
MLKTRQRAVTIAVLVVAASVVGFGGIGLAKLDSGGPAAQAGQSTNTVGAESANATIRGASAGDHAGAAVVDVGDVNGDGTPDVAVGAPTSDAGGNNSGAVYLFYGPVEGTNLSASNADAVLAGAQRWERAGFSVAGGDVNGDGTADLVVGAPAHVRPADAPNATRNGTGNATGTNATQNASTSGSANDSLATGAAYVVYGGQSLSGNVSLSNADATLLGAGTNDSAGHDVATVPNAGGGAAVAVGAPTADSSGNDSGAVYVVSGNVSGKSRLPAAGTVLAGASSGDHAGESVAGIGDVTGDGVPEVVVGAPRTDASGNSSGAVFIATGALGGNASDSSLSRAIRFGGAAAGDNAGEAVAAGDVTGDGTPDVVVGAPRNDAGGFDAGTTYVISGSRNLSDGNLASADATLVGRTSSDLSGWSLEVANASASCGNSADLVIGAPNADPRGNTTGAAYAVRSGVSNATDLSNATTYVGAAEGDLAGDEVGIVGGANGSGAGDVLVGAPRNDAAGPNAGAAYLFAGSCDVGTSGSATGTTNATGTTTGGNVTTTDAVTNATTTGSS